MNFKIKIFKKIIIITMLNKFKAQQRCTLNRQTRKLLARHHLHFVQLPLVCYCDWIVLLLLLLLLLLF